MTAPSLPSSEVFAPTSRGRRRRALAVNVLAIAAFVVALIPLASILLFVITQGLSAINLDFLTRDPPGDLSAVGGGVRNALVGTLEMTALATIVSVPVGLAIAVFSVETGGWLSRATRFTIDVLAGLPSIVVGLFVYTLVVVAQGHFSGYAGSVALAIIMLPTIVITTEEILRLTPRPLGEGTRALGMPRWRSIVSVFIPTGASGIITGVLLAISRAIGETAPLLFTALGNNFLTFDMGEPVQALPLLIYRNALNSAFPAARARAMGAALLLVLLVLAFNVVGRWLAARTTGARRR